MLQEDWHLAHAKHPKSLNIQLEKKTNINIVTSFCKKIAKPCELFERKLFLEISRVDSSLAKIFLFTLQTGLVIGEITFRKLLSLKYDHLLCQSQQRDKAVKEGFEWQFMVEKEQ